MGGEEASLFSGGQGGYLHLDDASTATAVSEPFTTFNGGSPTINFLSPGAAGSTSSLSLLQIGFMALAAIFVIREISS